MFRHRFGSRLPVARPHLVPPPRRQRVLAHRSLVCSFLLTLLLLLSQVLGNWGFLAKPAYAASPPKPLSTPANLTFQQFLKLTRPDRFYHGPYVRPAYFPKPAHAHFTDYSKLPPSSEPLTMKPINQPLTSAFLTGGGSAPPLDLPGSDGRLEVQIQPGALDLSHATVAGGSAPSGAFTLELSELSGHYVGSSNLLGTYQVQLVDSNGHIVSGIQVRTPITIIYHYQPWEMDALNLDPDHLLLAWPTLIAAARQAKQPTTGLIFPLHNDPKTHTLTAQSQVFGPGPFSPGGDPMNQAPPLPHVASVQGNAGQLSYGYPLLVPPGPAGFAPQLSLDYSSSDPNERHNPPRQPATQEMAGRSPWVLLPPMSIQMAVPVRRPGTF